MWDCDSASPSGEGGVRHIYDVFVCEYHIYDVRGLRQFSLIEEI
jgi:hypothetical protein